jgi:Domain of unknown function (DUF4430)
MAASPITITVKDNGNQISLPWQPDTNIQRALELAYDQEKAAGRKFSFALQFFGTDLGYMIIMMDGLLDNPSDPTDPYWWFTINGQSADVGIDDYIVQPGDSLEFDYTPFNPHKHTHGANAKKAAAYFGS